MTTDDDDDADDDDGDNDDGSDGDGGDDDNDDEMVMMMTTLWSPSAWSHWRALFGMPHDDHNDAAIDDDDDLAGHFCNFFHCRSLAPGLRRFSPPRLLSS